MLVVGKGGLPPLQLTRGKKQQRGQATLPDHERATWFRSLFFYILRFPITGNQKRRRAELPRSQKGAAPAMSLATFENANLAA